MYTSIFALYEDARYGCSQCHLLPGHRGSVFSNGKRKSVISPMLRSFAKFNRKLVVGWNEQIIDSLCSLKTCAELCIRRALNRVISDFHFSTEQA